MRKVFLVLIAALLIFSFAYAETFRQGDDRITFQQTTEVTKTSAYTVTAADSLINVTASSADIVITLPTVASLMPSSRSFKILKTDATAYIVTVTPATGDTIGGESARVLMAANDYIVISNSSGKSTDWQVNFESPYIAEDYESGTVTINAPSGGLRLTETITATDTLTRADCGKVFYLSHASTAIILTLPLPIDGCEMRFVTALAFGDQHEIRTPSATNIIEGTLLVNAADIDCTVEDSLEFADTAETLGDYVEIISDGTTWFIQDSRAATAAAIACTT